MRASDLRYERESKQHDLAIAMRAYGARLNTVVQWTGLSRYRVQSLSRFYEHDSNDTRRRGISPSQTAFFGRTLRLEAESLAVAFVAFEHQLIPESSEIQIVLPDVERGWRLVKAYETYVRLVPGAQIDLERMVLLISELSRGNLVLRACRTCPDVVIVDRFGEPHDRCPFCRSNLDTQSGRAPSLGQ